MVHVVFENDRLPEVSLVLVTAHGLDELAMPLPGILGQTIARRIELILVAPEGQVTEQDLAELSALHSVRLVEKSEVVNRGFDAAAGVVFATAPFVGLHENHTRAEPQTYERVLAAFKPEDGALAPVMYAANEDMAWGQAMYAVAHHHAGPPNSDKPKGNLVLHHGIYRTELLQASGENLRDEPGVQNDLLDKGYHLRSVPETAVWHLNESRPRMVTKVLFALGRLYGFARRGKISAPMRLVRLVLAPGILGLHILRCLKNGRDQAVSTRNFLRSAPVTAFAGAVFGLGEVVGYFDKQSAWLEDHELTELHVRGRIAANTPRATWLREAIEAIPFGTP